MLQLEIKTLSTADLPDVERKIKSLTVDIQTGFRDGARGAMDSIVKLAVSTEYLHDLTLAARKARLGVDVQRRKHITEQLAVCKDQTKFLLDSVRTMSLKSEALFKTSEGVRFSYNTVEPLRLRMPPFSLTRKLQILMLRLEQRKLALTVSCSQLRAGVSLPTRRTRISGLSQPQSRTNPTIIDAFALGSGSLRLKTRSGKRGSTSTT